MQTSIVPVSLGFLGTANAVQFRSVGFGPPPQYLYTLGNLTPGTPAVGTPGDKDYLPAVDPVFTAIPSAVGNINMTQSQWDSWGKDVSDTASQVACLLANLQLQPANA